MSGLIGVVIVGYEVVYVVFFRDGVFCMNVDFREVDFVILWIELEWVNVKFLVDDCEDEEEWKVWVTRMAVYLVKVENCCCVCGGLEWWVVSGSVVRNFDKWLYLVLKLSVV